MDNSPDSDCITLVSLGPPYFLKRYHTLQLFKMAVIEHQVEDMAILFTTSVEYLKSTPLRGSLFQNDYSPGIISSIFTEFYVDHTEPLAALQEYKDKHGDWPLGELFDGHEYFLAVPIV